MKISQSIPSGWEIKELGKIAIIDMGQSPDSKCYNKSKDGLPLIQGNADMRERRSIQRIYTTDITKVCDAGDFILSVRAPVGMVGIATKESCIGRGVCAIRPQKIDRELLFQLLLMNETNWGNIEQGSTFTAISSSDVKKFKVLLPVSREEQKSLADLLSTWDKAIDQMKTLIRQKQRRKRWLMKNFLMGSKRFPGFIKTSKDHKTNLGVLPVDWAIEPLEKLLAPVRSTLIPEQDTLYQQIGIRSHAKGIFHKPKVTGKILGDKRVFWVEPNCFIVNIVFAWEHAIAKTTEKEIGMIASHRFPMFKPKAAQLDLDYLLYFFKSPRGKHLLGLASPGGAGRNKTLGQSEFIKLQIPVPELAEQQAIARFLNTVERELELLKDNLACLEKQKSGLMQKLLTGNLRIKNNK
jgi:restriction endonuclease S subunit